MARQLAREWEEKLETLQNLEEDYRRFLREQPRSLSTEEREAIRSLAENIPALWEAPTTTMAERKEIVRQVIDRITVENEGLTERLHTTIDWVGGSQTTGVVVHQVRELEHLSYYPELCERVRELAAEGLSGERIARLLTREGYHSPRHPKHFSRATVYKLLRRLDLRRVHFEQTVVLGEDEWWLADLGRALNTPANTLHGWVERGWLEARKGGAPKKWIVRADEAEIERIRQHRAQDRRVKHSV